MKNIGSIALISLLFGCGSKEDSGEIEDIACTASIEFSVYATIYNEAADAIRAVQSGTDRASAMGVLPGITAGMDGMRFINACVTSAAQDAAWTNL